MKPDLSHVRQEFAEWCVEVRDGCLPRNYFESLYGMKERALQDLEQGRCLPSRSMVLLLTAIQMDPEFMQEVAKEAKHRLGMLDRCG